MLLKIEYGNNNSQFIKITLKIIQKQERELLKLVMACSYSPALYRHIASWPRLYRDFIGDMPQPVAAEVEDDECLSLYANRQDAALNQLADAAKQAGLSSLVILSADGGTMFNASNTPQIHVHIADSIWGLLPDADDREGQRRARQEIECDAALGAFLADELSFCGFDVSESRGGFRPADSDRGAGEALIASASRIAVSSGIKIVPIFVNCLEKPRPTGRRIEQLGRALGNILQMAEQSTAILASGGLSGTPGQYMAGWIDDVLDRWTLERLRLGRSADLIGIWDVESHSFAGSVQQIRLWLTAGAAAEEAGLRGRIVDYMPFHHGATGVGFMQWSSR